MAHCPYDQLQDIETTLTEIRKLPKIKEPKPGIFYLKSQGFLHFHLKDGRRWADARDGERWGKEIDLPFNPTKKTATEFLKEIRKRHASLI